MIKKKIQESSSRLFFAFPPLFLFCLCCAFLVFVACSQVMAQAEDGSSAMDMTTRILNSDTHQVTVKDLNDYCEITYQTKLECPSKVCFAYFDDQGESKGFVMRCKAKTCLNLAAVNCPLDACRIMQGCDDVPICYPPDTREPPQCGGLAYDGQDVPCCDGFIKRCGVEYFDGSCDMSGKYSIYGVPACLPCGNGTCNQFENKCNCPEDCK